MRCFILLVITVILSFSVSSNAANRNSAGAATGEPVVSKGLPDFGKLKTVKVAAEGSGKTELSALQNALQVAVLETNGAAFDEAALSSRLRISIHDPNDSTYLSSVAFGSIVEQESGGVISHFVLKTVTQPSHRWQDYVVKIEAFVKQYQAPSGSLTRTKVVVAPVLVSRHSYRVAGAAIAGRKLATTLHEEISNALMASGRFDVLSRRDDPVLRQELDLIRNGDGRSVDAAKLGQTLAADIVALVKVKRLSYTKRSRTLAFTNRPLVSYEGGWRIDVHIVNVATREIVASKILDGHLQPVKPTTFPVIIRSHELLSKAEQAVGDAVASWVIRDLYPVTIVAIQGHELVLSQGGKTLTVGASYRLERTGRAIRDPQTGKLIGHLKKPSGVIIIDRVGDHFSFGHLVGLMTPSHLPTNGSVQLGSEITPVQPGSAHISSIGHRSVAPRSKHETEKTLKPPGISTAHQLPITASRPLPSTAPSSASTAADSNW